MKCAVFASGGGTNFQSLIDHQKQGELHVEFTVLICNNSTAGAVERARKNNIPVVHLAPSQFADEAAYTARLLEVLRQHAVELIVLAGYMKKIPTAVIHQYKNRIVNIHPGLLPGFGGKGMYGQHVHEAVIAYGARLTGVTIHFVDEEYDHGPIIVQVPVEVRDEDDAEQLAARVLQVEHQWFWRAVEAISRGSLTVKGRRVCGSV
jgi:phosphoribosylglycinamide formyltransferase-1